MFRRFRVGLPAWQAEVIALVTVALLSGCSSDSTPTGDNGSDTGGQPFSAADFEAAENCGVCHPDQYNEWSGSMHAYALSDPVFFAVRELGQSQYVGALDGACTQCHSVIGRRGGETPWGPIDTAQLSPASREGVGCDLCHTVTSISNLGKGGVEFTPGHVKYGSTRNPVENPAHESEYHPLYPTSEYCGACHDLVTDQGLELEATFREWQKSGFAATAKTCNDCHMPTYIGRATPTSPERVLHRHTFPGVDVALVDFPNRPEQLAQVTELLQNALTMEVDVPSSASVGEMLSLTVRLINDKTGHNIPSGVPFNREMWLSVEVRDGTGSMVYSSGQLDDDGNLIQDEDLFNARATMLRVTGEPTGVTWEAADLVNPSIEAGETRTVNYDFTIPQNVSGNLTIDVGLHYRSFSPSLLRGLNLGHLLPIQIIDMEESSKVVTVS
jgi:hypothetical protein